MTPTPTPVSYLAGVLSTSDPLVQFLVGLIKGLAILAVALMIGAYAKSRMIRLLKRGNVSLTQANLFGNLVQVIFVLMGLIAILATFGVDWTGLLTLLGASGLAIALSLQDLLRNVVAGIYILMEQPFRIGDRITVQDVTGVVQGIELRTTVLCTDENLQVVVPNNVMLNEIITNRSASELQRQVIMVRASKGNLAETSTQITEALKSISEVATDPAPAVVLEGAYADSSVLRVEFWLPGKQRVALTPQVVEAVQARFPDSNITVVKS